MRITMLPKTILGRWSVGLALAFFVIPILVDYIVYPTNGLLAFIRATTWEIYISIGTGLVGFITGLMAIIKLKERSILVYLSIVIGLVALFTLVDIIQRNV